MTTPSTNGGTQKDSFETNQAPERSPTGQARISAPTIKAQNFYAADLFLPLADQESDR